MVSNACSGFCAAVLLSFWLGFGLILGWNGEEQEAAEEQGRMVAIGGNIRTLTPFLFAGIKRIVSYIGPRRKGKQSYIPRSSINTQSLPEKKSCDIEGVDVAVFGFLVCMR